jgi:hypothetical protein
MMESKLVKLVSRLALLVGFSSSVCFAGYYDVLDNGEILPKGTYKLGGNTQLLTNPFTGVNIGATIDAGFEDQYGMRAIAGFGKTDYFLGAMFKWMPIPDVQNQPAVGFNVGLIYGRWFDQSELTIRGEPLVSKKFAMGGGYITPYAALPIGILMRNSNTKSSGTDVTWQVAVGSQVQVERWKNLQFIGEVGLDISNAFSYVSLGAVWYFDEQNGFELK